MTNFDVFNGDADGIISLVQLRRVEPRVSKLVTGRKRDIQLLRHVDAKHGDNVTVLDISMRSNAESLTRILKAGAHVFYVDHHNPGDVPVHDNLHAIIDTSSEMCTAMLIDSALEGAHRAWAVTAAFGDNFPKLARAKAKGHDFPLEQLERLGMLINYNGYGADLSDLIYDPKDLYADLVLFDTPMQFLTDKYHIFQKLDESYESDLSAATYAEVLDATESGQVLCLENSASSRRISGVFGNQLAQAHAGRAHAILTRQDGGFLVSIRAPLSKRRGADTLALKFDTGGGRSAAAGINHLPETELDRFVQAFREAFA